MARPGPSQLIRTAAPNARDSCYPLDTFWLWIQPHSVKIYKCTDATHNAAVWTEVLGDVDVDPKEEWVTFGPFQVVTFGATISANRAIYLNSSKQAIQASNAAESTSRVFGITRVGTSSGRKGLVQTSGIIKGNWSINSPGEEAFLSTGGLVVVGAPAPVSGAVRKNLGLFVDDDILDIRIQEGTVYP